MKKNINLYYEIDEYGNVNSIDRIILRKDGITRTMKGRRLIFNISHSGYQSVMIGRENRLYIHRMVAELFVPNPLSLPQVNHKDGNKINNHYLNLEWVSASGNIRHSYMNGRTTGKGINRDKRKIILVRDCAVLEFDSIKQAIETIGGSHSGLSHVLHGRATTFKGFNAYFV